MSIRLSTAARNAAADAATDVKNAINDIPSNKKVDVTLTLITNKAYQDFRQGERDAFGVGPKPRAKGGPVRAGDPYIVGEKGPELIVPRYHGNVIPNHELGSGSSVSGGGDRIDYARLGDEVAHSMGKATLAVGVRDVTQAVNYRNSTRARY